VPLTLENFTIKNAGVSVNDVIWRWQFSLNGTDWTDIVTTTHRVYIVLCLPTEPWEPMSFQPTNIQIPWTEVLDQACCWAAGALNVDTAAGMVTENVNALGCGKVTYFEKALYIEEATDNFYCTEFLDLINGGPGKGNTMNCSDCATAVSTFANVLGASLAQSCMGKFFNFNPVRKIGEGFSDGGNFSIHEVAWKGRCTKDDAIFDACLHLDGDQDPGNDPFVALLPKNLPFEDQAGGYHFRIARKNVLPVCEPFPDSARRPLDRHIKSKETPDQSQAAAGPVRVLSLPFLGASALDL
jgi:hypothetical protein